MNARIARVCKDCARERLTTCAQSKGERCTSCQAFRREAIHRLARMRPLLERLAAAVATARHITDIGTAALRAVEGEPDGSDVRLLSAQLANIEADLEQLADEWTVLLLRTD